MKYKLINIGRDKVNRIVDVVHINRLHKEVKQHLFSPNIDLITDDNGETFRVYAGVRNVGTVERIYD